MQLQGIRLLRRPSELIFRAQGRQISGLKVEIYGLSGAKLLDSGFSAGRQLRWNFLTTSGSRPLANGVYLYVVTVRGPSGRLLRDQVRKLVLLR